MVSAGVDQQVNLYLRTPSGHGEMPLSAGTPCTFQSNRPNQPNVFNRSEA